MCNNHYMIKNKLLILTGSVSALTIGQHLAYFMKNMNQFGGK